MTLQELLVRLSLDTSQFRSEISEAKKETAGLTSAGQAMTDMGARLTTGITLPIVGLGAAAVSSYSNIESLKMGLIAITGSAEEANRQFAELVELAKLPGLGLEEVAKASLALQAVGFSAEGAKTAIAAFGNALATVGRGREELDRLTVQLQQMVSKPKVEMQDLKLIMEAVPQAATIIRDKFGELSTEAINSTTNSQGFIQLLVDELGKLPPVTGGIKNSIENAKDAINQSLAAIGAAIAPIVSSILDGLVPAIQSVARWFYDLSPASQSMIMGIAAVAAAIGPLVFVLGQLFSSLAAIKVGIAALTPILGTIWPLLVGIAAAFAAWKLGEWLLTLEPVNKAMEALGDALSTLWGWINKIPGVSKIVGGMGDAFDAVKGQVSKFTSGLFDARKEQDKTADATKAASDMFSHKMTPAVKDNTKEIEAMEKAYRKSQLEIAKMKTEHLEATLKTIEAREQTKALNDYLLTGAIPTSGKAQVAVQAYADAMDGLEKAAMEARPEITLSKEAMDAVASSGATSATNIGTLSSAFDTLGMKSASDATTIAQQAAIARDAILGSNVATDFEKKTATYKALQAQMEASKQAGIDIPADQKLLYDNLKAEVEGSNGLPAVKSAWSGFAGEVSTIVTNMAEGISKSLWSGDLSWKEKGIEALRSLGEAATSMFLKPFTDAIATFVSTSITKLLGGEGLGGVSSALDELGAKVTGLFGGTSGVATDAAGAASGAAGSVGSAGGGAGSAAGASSGIWGAVGAIGSISSAISGVIGNFQMAGMNKSLDLIEGNTRYAQLYLGGRADQGILGVLFSINEQLSWGPLVKAAEAIRDTLLSLGASYINPSLDTIKDTLAGLREDLRGAANGIADSLTMGFASMRASGAGGGNITINVYEGASQRGRGLAVEIAQQIRLQQGV